MRRCVLHIGVTKTGSTTVQDVLWRSSASLRACGIAVPDALHNTLVAGVLPAAQAARYANGLSLDALRTLAAAPDVEHLVLSAESLSRPKLDPARVAAFLDGLAGLGFEVTVVAFVRPQAGYVNSVYAQSLKGLRHGLDFGAYLQGHGHSPHYRFGERLAPWTGHPGTRFVALPFHTGALDPDMAGTVLRAGGIPAEQVGAARLVPGIRRNASFGPLAVAACRHLHAALVETRPTPAPADPAFDLDAWLLAQTSRRGWNDQAFSGFDDDGAAAFSRGFAVDNDRFAMRWWGRRWDDVFAAEAGRRWRRNEIDLAALSAEHRQAFDGLQAELLRDLGSGRR